MADDLQRYHRQMLLPDFGEVGQRKLAEARSMLVGCGALGCAIADFLVRAGVGDVTLIDRDVVELTNLQRQTLFDERDAAEALPKAEAARRRLESVNSKVRIQAIVADLNAASAERIVRQSCPQILLDGTDNFETRYLLNDLAVKHGLPYVYGGVIATHGMQMTVIPGKSPCLRCLFETAPPPGSMPTCDTAGVFGPVVSIVAACQASDAIKLLLGRPDLVSPALLELDLWSGQHRRLDMASARRPDCPCCGEERFEFLDGTTSGATVALCGQNAIQVSPPAAAGEPRVDLAALAGRLSPHGRFEHTRFLLRGELSSPRAEGGSAYGLTVFADGRAIVRGTTKPEIARALYARFVGG